MTGAPEPTDPWAWARERDHSDADPRRQDVAVAAVVVAHNGERWLAGLLESLASQALTPRQVIVVDAGSTDATHDVAAKARQSGSVSKVVRSSAGSSFGAGVAAGVAVAGACDWLWLLHDDTAAGTEALERLVATGTGDEGAAIVGPLLAEPRRRRSGPASRVSEAGQTITYDGVITGVVAEGIIDQGQLDRARVLGVNACGMLVRRDVWDALGGFDDELPSAVQGLEFCWRAMAAGHVTMTEPKARLVHVEASTRGIREDVTTDPRQDLRRWGLALNEAFRVEPMTAGERGRLGAASIRRVAGFVLGKDLLDARLERAAVREWRGDRSSVERLRERFLATGDASAAAAASGGLRLTRRLVRARLIDDWFGRLVDWLSGFGARDGGPGIEALTGDDYARDDHTRPRVSPMVVVGWVLVVAAVLAGGRLLSPGLLSGSQLLPVPDTFDGLFAQYADPVAGVSMSAGAPWTGLLWVASLLTLGHPDVLISLILLAGIPVAFVIARRFLGRLVDDRGVAIAGAALYALLPVLTGAVSAGRVGTVVWAILLPALGSLVHAWWEEGRPSWTITGAVGLTATLMAAVEPLTWLGLVAALVVLVRLDSSGWRRAVVAALAPAVLLITPYTAELIAFPGRLLTGIEPLLAPSGSTPTPLALLLGRVGPNLPALWISVVVWGVLWLLAVVGAVVRTKSAGWALAAALFFGLVAVVLTRLVLPIPPTGQVARPQAGTWVVAMGAALVGALCLGLEHLRKRISEIALGAWHAVYYGAALLAAVAVLLTAGWWVVDSDSGLTRSGTSGVPAFIRKDAARGNSRTLALNFEGGTARWSLLEDDLPRLGDAERGLVFGGLREADDTAGSVARRLAVGSADERIVPDLRRLGVGYLWITGASAEQLASLSNVPGLGVGAIDDQGANWAIPDSGRIVLKAGDKVTRQEVGATVAPGEDGRVLVLAEPPDPALSVSLGGQELPRAADVDGRPAFNVPASGGAQLSVGSPRASWAWMALQGLAFLALLALAAPGAHTDREPRARAPRRSSPTVGGAS